MGQIFGTYWDAHHELQPEATVDKTTGDGGGIDGFTSTDLETNNLDQTMKPSVNRLQPNANDLQLANVEPDSTTPTYHHLDMGVLEYYEISGPPIVSAELDSGMLTHQHLDMGVSHYYNIDGSGQPIAMHVSDEDEFWEVVSDRYRE